MALIFVLAGCSTMPKYESVPINKVDSVVVENYNKNIRYNGKITYEDEVYIKKECEKKPKTDESKPTISYLAISGGSDNGAYAAGFLNGWTKSGTRPKFQIVTGVSTGAIIAPFAFLGSKYDSVLKKMYTTVEKDNVFLTTFVDIVDGVIWGLAVSDTSPLRQQLKTFITPEIIKKIAVEHKHGRRLYISTTNLDTQKPVIWDIGAIAASNKDNSLDLIINIMLASSALPGMFPPVFFDVNVDGHEYKELHVDGGIVSQLLLPPEIYTTDCDSNRKMYLIRNSKLHSEYKVVRPRTFDIFRRSLASIIKYQAYGDLYRMYLAVKNNNIDYNLASIPDDFECKTETSFFDKKYMNTLFDRAYHEAASGYKWKKNPF